MPEPNGNMGPMELIDAFDTAFDEWDRIVHEVDARHLDAPTGCSEWNVRELLNHLISEHLWAPPLLGGAPLQEVGSRFDGDLTGDDPVAAWEQAGAASRPAFHRPGALDGQVHVTGGRTPAEEYGWQMTSDLAVHSWDLAQGTGSRWHIPDELGTDLYDRVAPQIDGLQGLGLFGPPQDPPPNAGPPERLLSLLGRNP